MKIKKVLGEGSYGSVVVCEKNGETFALKTVKGDDYGLVSLQEIDVMNSVYNPFLVSARKTYIENNTILIFMDLASETLHRHKISGEGELRNIVFQMITSLAFLEKKNIIHGDIKGNNFLCYKNTHGLPLNVRLTDFSLACRSYGIPPKFRMYCSVYRPIESWFSEAECKSDVWALGCCIYELLTGESQLFPSQDERYDETYCDTLSEIIQSPVRQTKVHKRWRPSFDIYVSILGQFAEKTGQPISRRFQKRCQDSEARVEKFSKPLNIFVREWGRIYRALPPYLRDMLTVDPAKRPSATQLFHSDYFREERRELANSLSEYYLKAGIPHSDGELVLLDGASKHHAGRVSLDYEDIDFFMTRPKYSRITLIAAMDMFSKCKHIENKDYVKFTCLFISIKLTDPSSIDVFEQDKMNYFRHPINDEFYTQVIVELETVICQTLNYVLYPEDEKIFELSDNQLIAFYV
ncbi:MAG: protein kinase [Cyanobacteriota bacterium]|nr:protein kinase [Cyanobacteriota bacterium]